MSCLPTELTDKKPKIFICATAYQVYVASKLVQAFDVKEPILFVGAKKRPPKITKALLTLAKWKKIYYVFEDPNHPWGLFRLWYKIRQMHILFEGAHIFSGSIGEICVSMSLSVHNVASVSIFDDGMEAFLYLDGFRYTQSQTLKRKIFNVLLSNLLGGKVLDIREVYEMSHRFYTFFDVNTDPRIIHIPTRGLLSESVKKVEQKRCVLLGQPLYQDEILPTYQLYAAIITQISTLLSQEGYDLYYYPHPCEKILSDKYWESISIIQSEDIIQVWVENNFVPTLFVGFMTTALISLKLIYPSAKCISYDIKSLIVSRVEHIHNIYKEMSKYGVEIRELKLT